MSERDKYDLLAERLLPFVVLSDSTALHDYAIVYRPAVAAELRKANQAANHWCQEANQKHNENVRLVGRIEKLEAVLRRYAEVDGRGEIARAALEE